MMNHVQTINPAVSPRKMVKFIRRTNKSEFNSSENVEISRFPKIQIPKLPKTDIEVQHFPKITIEFQHSYL